jgi:hypothetical protein
MQIYDFGFYQIGLAEFIRPWQKESTKIHCVVSLPWRGSFLKIKKPSGGLPDGVEELSCPPLAGDGLLSPGGSSTGCGRDARSG